MPRTCGDDPEDATMTKTIGFKCPAPAGMIPGALVEGVPKSEMPRTCGDDPQIVTNTDVARKNAPHLRG